MILENVPNSKLNGHPTKRLPNNVNISFLGVEGEAVVLYLDSLGDFVSTGSACTSKTLDPSHVLVALGLSHEAAHGSIRFTFGKETSTEDIDYVVEVLPGIVEKLRSISTVDIKKFGGKNE